MRNARRLTRVLFAGALVAGFFVPASTAAAAPSTQPHPSNSRSTQLDPARDDRRAIRRGQRGARGQPDRRGEAEGADRADPDGGRRRQGAGVADRGSGVHGRTAELTGHDRGREQHEHAPGPDHDAQPGRGGTEKADQRLREDHRDVQHAEAETGRPDRRPDRATEEPRDPEGHDQHQAHQVVRAAKSGLRQRDHEFRQSRTGAADLPSGPRWQRRQIRVRAARQAVRVGGRRPRLVRLLRPRARRVPEGRRRRSITTRPMQWGEVHHISRSELEPGDLVFYEPGNIHHVAIYIGSGKVIHAPTFGEDVKIAGDGHDDGDKRVTGSARVQPRFRPGTRASRSP